MLATLYLMTMLNAPVWTKSITITVTVNKRAMVIPLDNGNYKFEFKTPDVNFNILKLGKMIVVEPQ